MESTVETGTTREEGTSINPPQANQGAPQLSSATATSQQHDTFAPKPSLTHERVQEGDWLIVRVNEGAKYVVVEVRPKSLVRLLKKKSFAAEALIGREYGEFLELDKKNKVRPWDRSRNVQASKLGDDEYENIGDNRHIKRNDPSVQALSYEEIEAMKRNDELDTASMIDKVAAANHTFGTKTIFSQEKYLKKKQAKHLSVFQILRPTARTVSEAYFHKAPAKTYFLRPDSVAQMLSLSNATSGDNILVHESASGLLLGALAERLAGRGRLISLFTEQEAPVVNAFRCFNFTELALSTYLPVAFHQLEPLAELELAAFDAEPLADDFPFRQAKPATLEILKQARVALEQPVDSLVICSRFNPADVLYELFKYVRGSGHVVIFHTHLEPLLQCHEMLHDSQEALCIELRESWCRDYQVLPLRTHPLMRMHGTSGYILSAIKVLPSDPLSSAPAPKKQRRA